MHAVARSTQLRIAAALLIAGCLATASAREASAAKAEGAFSETLLSNERDTSRWAFVSRRVSAFSRPGNHGRKLRTLSPRTPDHTSELVVALRERVYDDGSVWTEVRLPMRGTDPRGWVSRRALDRYRVIHTRIEIDRAAARVEVFKWDRPVLSASIASGGPLTPTGAFYVRNRLHSSDPRGRFGPAALGLSASVLSGSDWPGGRTIGTHGTNKPGSVPGTDLDPCVRLKNRQMKLLFALTPPGAPVTIR